MSSNEDGIHSGDGEIGLFDVEKHVRYLEMMYEMLPSEYEGQEINHLTLAYFIISGLDVLGALDRVDKGRISNWVLSFQEHPENRITVNDVNFYGFYGSRTSQFLYDDTKVYAA